MESPPQSQDLQKDKEAMLNVSFVGERTFGVKHPGRVSLYYHVQINK